HVVTDRTSPSGEPSDLGYDPTKLVSAASTGRRRSVRSEAVTTRLVVAGVLAWTAARSNRSYRYAVAPTAQADASSTTAAPAINDARRLSHPNRGTVGRCRSRLLAACDTISGVMRLVCTEKPASSARSQIRLISRGMPSDSRWTSSSAFGANVTAADPPAIVNRCAT